MLSAQLFGDCTFVSHMNRQIFVVTLALFGLQACKNVVADPHACYSTTVEQIIITNCSQSGCHNSKDRQHGVDLSSYAEIKKHVVPGNAMRSELYTVLNRRGEEQMPPSGKLSASDIEIIKNWINLGANETVCASQSCDSSDFTFSTGVSPIIAANCKGCHLSSSGNGIVLTDYPSVTAAVNAGRFYGSIHHLGGYVAMPQNLPALSTCQLRIIDKWIAKGMPQN